MKKILRFSVAAQGPAQGPWQLRVAPPGPRAARTVVRCAVLLAALGLLTGCGQTGPDAKSTAGKPGKDMGYAAVETKPVGPEGVPSLVKALQSDNGITRSAALESLKRAKPEAVPILIKNLSHKDKGVRAAMAIAL